jgi:hypothetical protein
VSFVPLATVAVVAAAAPTPVQLYTSSLAAARAQHSVHYVAATVFPGRAVTIVGDAARDRGIQRITVRQGAQTGHVTVIVVANVAYVRGDAPTLQSYMGFTAADATRYGGRWLSIRPSQARFKPVAEAVRLVSTIGELAMPPPFTATPPATVAGQRVKGVRATFTRSGQKLVETLYVRASGSPLPVEQVAATTSGVGLSTTFSRWNEAVRVAAPAGAIPLP